MDRRYAHRLTVETDDGDWGVKLTANSCGELTKCNVMRTKPSGSIKEKTFGVDAETGASLACRDCEVSGWMTGIHAGRSSSMEMWGAKATGNVYGAGVYLAASISAFDSSFDFRGGRFHGVRPQLKDNEKNQDVFPVGSTEEDPFLFR